MSEALAEPAGGADQLFIDLEGRRFPVLIRRRSTSPSVHTGRSLTELHAWAVTSDPAIHLWLAEALKKAVETPVRLSSEAEEHLGRWTLSWNAYGEVGGEHRYTLILRECEELDLEALVVDGIELHPYEYREEPTNGGLTIFAKLVGSEEDVHELRRVLRGRESVPVVRRGIEDAPREMRLGVGEWTEHEDRMKYRIVLLEAGVDDASHPELVRIRRENNRAALGFYMNFAERLVGLLVDKGVLTEKEVEAAREAASFEPVAVGNDFWRVVSDIDDR
jgi:hypothetical protein